MHNDKTHDGSVEQDAGRQGSTIWIVAGMVAAGGIAPVLLYWFLFGRISTVTPEEAKHMLRAPKSGATLVDVREPESYLAEHIDGAVNWPLSELVAAENLNEVPKSLSNQTLLLISDVGIASRQAARQLQTIGASRAYSVRGGTQEWIRSFAHEASSKYRPQPAEFPQALWRVDPPRGDLFDRLQVGRDRIEEFPFRVFSLGKQLAAFLAYFVVKPIYTLLALAVAVVLWQRHESDLVALRWSMISFFLGENASRD